MITPQSSHTRLGVFPYPAGTKINQYFTIESRKKANQDSYQNPPPNLTMPFINKELQQFCLHLNINNNTFQTLGYQDFHYFDGESGMIIFT